MKGRSKMKISVLITTFNGETNILDQLSSIYNQTVLPDEVVVFDDCSTDKTTSLVSDFIQRNSLTSKWKIVINEKRMGIRNNFLLNTIKLEGDLIFYCDQDDLWMPSKIQDIKYVYEHNDDFDVVCHNTIGFVDITNKSVKRHYKIKNSDKLDRVCTIKQIHYGFAPAHAMSMKRSFFELHFQQLSISKAALDLSIALIAASQCKYAILHKVLVKHRIHLNNSSKPVINMRKRVFDISRQLESRKVKLDLLINTYSAIEENLSTSIQKRIQKTIYKIEKDIIYLTTGKRFSLLLNNLSFEYMDRRHSLINIAISIFCKFDKSIKNE